jgi:Ca-activated chloride channel family protein
MRLGYPVACWLLLLLPGIYLLLSLGRQRQAAFLRRFGDPTLLQQTPARLPALRTAWVCTTLLLLSFLSIILALADPRLRTGAPYLRAGALDVVMLLDISTSMAAEDYGLRSRFEQAREMARSLLPDLRGNRVGVITFAGTSFRQADLTEDLDALDFILQSWVAVDGIEVGGSNIAQAIATGLDLFPQGSTRQQLMLLFSDGGDGEEPLHSILSHVARRGIRIVTLGLGHLEPARIPRYNAHQAFVGYLQANEQIVTTSLHEAPLQQIATATGGTYLRIVRGDEGRNLLTREAVVGKTLTQKETRLFQLFLGMGLGAFGIYTLLIRL